MSASSVGGPDEFEHHALGLQVSRKLQVTDKQDEAGLLKHDSSARRVVQSVVQHYGLQDPTCAKVAITGQMLPVPTEKLDQAEELLFSRHPSMRSWPVGHHFTV